MADEPAEKEEQKKDFREFFQKKVVNVITEDLDAGKMAEARAKEIDSFVLDITPKGQSVKETYTAALVTCGKYLEFMRILAVLVKEFKANWQEK